MRQQPRCSDPIIHGANLGSGFLEQRDGGLSVFGLSIMERMQQVGMAVDVSHCGDQTTLDALAAASTWRSAATWTWWFDLTEGLIRRG